MSKTNELLDWYDEHYGPNAKPGTPQFVGSDRVARDVDLPKLSALQRLEYANRGTMKPRATEPPLTDEERGMSPADFERLPAQRRLEIANAAHLKRSKTRRQ